MWMPGTELMSFERTTAEPSFHLHFTYLLIMYRCTCVQMKKTLDPLELELQEFVSCQTCVLGT